MARPKMTKQQKLEKINADPILWLKNFIKIVNNQGELIKFELNNEQKYFIDHMEKYNIIAKSRQIGFTTLSLGLMLYYACNKPNTTYLVLSYSVESVQNIFERLKLMYESIPQEYKPGEVRNNRMELKLTNGSRIIVKVAGNKSIGRSFTCEMILCSEFAFWPDEQQSKGLLGLEQALSKNDKSILVIETTSNGYNYYQKLFMQAYKGHSKYKAFFFNWYQNKEQFKAEYNLAEAWYKSINHGDRMREKDLDIALNEPELLNKGASYKQLMWRRWKLQDMTEQEFCQEFPSTPEESFISTSNCIFDINKINSRYNYLPPLRKEKIPESLAPYYCRGFFIYQNPLPGERYYIGVDTASGGGGDNSALAVYDSAGEQVAVFFDNKIPVYKFAKVVNDIGHLYNYAFLVVERNSYGLSVIERLRREYGYLNMFKMKHFDERGKKKLQLGWTTTAVSKAKLINDFKEQFELDLILINDSNTLDEMKIYMEKENGSMGNIRGLDKHDDLVISSALAIQGLKANKWYV